MQAYDEFISPFFISANEAWTELNRRVDAALQDIDAAFYCGLLAGSAPEQLFNALHTELVLIEDTGHFRPRLVQTSPTAFLLKIPRNKLLAHGDVMKTAYLLRAYAHYFLGSTESDAHALNRKAWSFLESKMFGHMPILNRQLMDVSSLEQLHEDGVPMSLLLGYMANHRPGFSMCSRYHIVPYNGLPNIEHSYVPATPLTSKTHRLLGKGHHQIVVPHLVDEWQSYGLLDSREIRSSSHLIGDFEGFECFITKSLSSELFAEKNREPVGALVRTVVCTNDLSTGRLFQPFLSSGVLH